MRLFVAVNFTDNFKNAVLEYQTGLQQYARDAGCRANWSRPENLHLTLAFIGEYPAPHPVLAALGEVRFAQFTVTAGKSGQFGSLRWVGLKEEADALELGLSVRNALTRHGIPFDPKPMKPHITVARELSGEIPKLRVREESDTVAAFSLMKSERIAGRLIYTELRRFHADA